MHYWFVSSLTVTVFITTVSFVTSFYVMRDHVFILNQNVYRAFCVRDLFSVESER